MNSHRQIAAVGTIAAALVALALCGFGRLGAGLAFADQPKGAAAPAGSSNAEPGALVSSGINAYDQGDYSGAINDLSAAQKLYPTNSSVSLYLGLAYLKQDRLADAIAAWQRYLKLKPSTEAERTGDLSQKIPQYLTILLREHDHQQAEEAVAHEREIGPGDPHTVAITYYRNLGSPFLNVLRKGLAALLIDDVSKVPGIKVVERDRMQALLDEMKLGSSGLASSTTAARTGRLLGAGRVATGSYVDPTAAELNIDSALMDTSAAHGGSTQAANGRTAQFYEIEKQLAAKLLKDLGHDESTLPEGVVREIQKPQTVRYSAFESFSRGLDARDRQDYPAARGFFQQALTYDPNFKLAGLELLYTPTAPLAVRAIQSNVRSSAPSASAAAAAAAAAAASAGAGVSTATGGGSTGGGSTGGGSTGGPTGGVPTGGAPAVPIGGLTNGATIPPVPPPCPPLICPACVVAVHR